MIDSGDGRRKEPPIDETLLLGIDLGTSNLKAGLYNDRGEVILLARSAVPMIRSHPGVYEQDPRAWWEILCNLLRELVAEMPGVSRAIRVVGVCGQSHGPTPFSRTGQPLANCITWLDRRGDREVSWIAEHVGEGLLSSEGNPPADTCYTAAKVLWTRETKPGLFADTHKFLLPKDVLTFWLTGEYGTDTTDASVTDLFSEQAQDWSKSILDRMGIEREKLPPVRKSWDVIGEVSEQAALQTGLEKGTPVIAGAADWACLYYGAGGIKPGVTIDLSGTVGGVLTTTSSHVGLPSAMSIIPGLRHAFGCCIESSSAVYEWYRGILGRFGGRNPVEVPSLADLDSSAETVPPGAGGIIVVPRFAGARRPERSDSRGSIIGLTLSSTASQVARAILEGLAFEYRRGVERMRAVGIPCRRIRAIGGGARSAVWRQIKADVTGAEYEAVNIDEVGAFGVAMLGGYAIGMFPSLQSPIEEFVAVTEVAIPRDEAATTYNHLYHAYCRAVEVLESSGIYGGLGEVGGAGHTARVPRLGGPLEGGRLT